MTDWDTIVREALEDERRALAVGPRGVTLRERQAFATATREVVERYMQVSAQWRDYAARKQEEPMPDLAARQPAPEKNPYRSDGRNSRSAVQPDHPLAGFQLRDLDTLLARHFEHGRHVGADEVRAENASWLATTYDEGWRHGMAERHDGITNAYGNRIHVLHELLHLAASQLNLGSAALASLAELAHDVLGTLIAEHDDGPFAAPYDERGMPDDGTLGEGEPEDGALPKPTAQQAEDAMRARAILLRNWLEELTRPARADEPQPSAMPADESTLRRHYAEHGTTSAAP